jgi:hypothetical protein
MGWADEVRGTWYPLRLEYEWSTCEPPPEYSRHLGRLRLRGCVFNVARLFDYPSPDQQVDSEILVATLPKGSRPSQSHTYPYPPLVEGNDDLRNASTLKIARDGAFSVARHVTHGQVFIDADFELEDYPLDLDRALRKFFTP